MTSDLRPALVAGVTGGHGDGAAIKMLTKFTDVDMRCSLAGAGLPTAVRRIAPATARLCARLRATRKYMSMEILVALSRDRSPSSEVWQSALIESKVPVEFSELIDIQKHFGFAPMRIHGRQSGFYFTLESYVDVCASYPMLGNIGVAEPVVYWLGYGDFLECACVSYAASVLVGLFGGVAFDPQGRIVLTEKELVHRAWLCEGA